MKWKLVRNKEHILNEGQKSILEDFPFDEVAQAGDDLAIIEKVKSLVSDKEVVIKILSMLADFDAIDAVAVFAVINDDCDFTMRGVF